MRTMANDLVKLLINTLFHHHDPLVVGVLGLCNSIAKPVSDIRRCTMFVGVSRSVISILSCVIGDYTAHAAYHCVHLCMYSPHVANIHLILVSCDIFGLKNSETKPWGNWATENPE